MRFVQVAFRRFVSPAVAASAPVSRRALHASHAMQDTHMNDSSNGAQVVDGTIMAACVSPAVPARCTAAHFLHVQTDPD